MVVLFSPITVVNCEKTAASHGQGPWFHSCQPSRYILCGVCLKIRQYVSKLDSPVSKLDDLLTGILDKR